VYKIALKMLFNDRVKYLTLLVGLTFATVLISQQGSIFCGLMMRTGSTIFDTNVPLWILDPKVLSVNDQIPIQESALHRVRSVEGVAWAVPMIMQNLFAKGDQGDSGVVQIIGVDDESLVGLPPNLVAGRYEDLNQPEAVLVSLSRRERFGSPGLGDYFELNNRRARVVGLVDSIKNFVPFPSIYTTYDKARQYIPPQQKILAFILAQPKPGYTLAQVQAAIRRETGLEAYPQLEFFWRNMFYWAKNTGIPINFGITIVLGVLIGAAISGQTLYTFVIENARQFGTFKAIGVKDQVLVRMVLLQSLVMGLISFGIGVGVTSLVGLLAGRNGELAYYTPWQLYVLTLLIVVGFCTIASLISIRQVLKLDPAMVFRG
jgi:putative ABC transport system permease protein